MVHIKNKQTKKTYHVLLQMEDEAKTGNSLLSNRKFLVLRMDYEDHARRGLPFRLQPC